MMPSQLYEIRYELGWTQEDMAREVGVSSGRTVRRWEHGERKIPESVAKLLHVIIQLSRERPHFGKV